MTIEADRVIKTCLRIAAKLKDRHPRHMKVIRMGVVQSGTHAQTLQLELDALHALATALALGTQPRRVDLDRVNEVLRREGVLLARDNVRYEQANRSAVDVEAPDHSARS